MEFSLDKLPITEEGKIKRLDVAPNLKRRLLDLGLVYNTKIKCLYKSPLNDPRAYLVRGSVIALRNTDAKNIYISYDENKGGGDINGIN